MYKPSVLVYRTFVCFQYTLFTFEVQYIFQTFVRFYFCFYLLYEFQRALLNSVAQSSSVLDTFYYLYGESNKSTIPTFNARAILSKLSSVGEYFSVMMLLIVDFGMPVKFDNCRTDTFFSYITFVSSIFMSLVCNVFLFLYLINSLRRFNKNYIRRESV